MMPVQRKSTRRAAGKSGWVYVAVDKNAPDLVKIGQTQVPDARHKQLGKPQYLARIPCTDCKQFEEKLHRKFEKYRCAQSEYFNLSDESLDLLLRMCASEYEDFKSFTVEPSLANKLEQVETEIKLISKFGSTGMQLREVRTRSDHKHNCLAEGCDELLAEKDTVCWEVQQMDWINLPDGTCFDNAYAVLCERFLEAGYEEDAKDFNQRPSRMAGMVIAEQLNELITTHDLAEGKFDEDAEEYFAECLAMRGVPERQSLLLASCGYAVEGDYNWELEDHDEDESIDQE